MILSELGVARCFGETDLWRRAIAALMDDLPGALADIEVTFSSGRYGDLRLLAHQLYGATIFCGIPGLEVAIRKLEVSCVNAPDKIEGNLEELRRMIALLTEFVDKHGIPEV